MPSEQERGEMRAVPPSPEVAAQLKANREALEALRREWPNQLTPEHAAAVEASGAVVPPEFDDELIKSPIIPPPTAGKLPPELEKHIGTPGIYGERFDPPSGPIVTSRGPRAREVCKTCSGTNRVVDVVDGMRRVTSCTQCINGVPISDAPQNSEVLEAVSRDPVYLVCRSCGDAVFLDESAIKVKCQCGKSQVTRTSRGDVFTDYAIPITELVRCGKLTVYRDPDGKGSRCVLAVSNRLKRTAPGEFVGVSPDNRSAEERVATAANAIEKQAAPVIGAMIEAVKAGAKVTFSAHYHNRACGIERTETGQYVKRESTGDFRFFGQVITRGETDEPDGSLIFGTFKGCARCGKDHVNVAFWKYMNPVREFDPLTVGNWKVTATHFGFCPTNGEPIIMFSDKETDVKPIDGPEPAAMSTVGGVGGSSPLPAAREVGEAAGRSGTPRDSNPYPYGSREHSAWDDGHKEGGGKGHG